jgi:hypothetical protein
MFKNKVPASNVSDSVRFILRGANKRRTMAYANVKMLQSEMGMAPRLVAVK